MGPKPVLPKNYSYKGTQNKNLVPLRYKCVECHSECYKYKTKECLELHDKLHPHNREEKKIQELKERNDRTVFKEKNTDVETEKEKIPCENMYRVTNEDTPENQAE